MRLLQIISQRWMPALALGWCAISVHAQQVELTTPLDGYTRLGKATAVHVSGEGLSAGRLTLSGPGVLPIQVASTAGRVEATLPVLVQGVPPDTLQWSSGRARGTAALSSRSLGPDERLIAVAADEVDVKTFSANLFPGKSAVAVKLDVSRPRLLWPPQAYDAADAVLLDLASAARVDESQLRVLLAAGTTVAIRSPSRPAGQWPWKQQGAWWVLRHTPLGPHGGVNVDAYDPTYAWDRSWPRSERRSVLWWSVLGGLLIAGASLWRGRPGFVVAMIACVCSLAGALFYVLSLRPAVLAGGDVVVWDGELAQRDRWTYVSALRDANLSVEAADRARPVLGTGRQMETLGLTLTCDPTGFPVRYEFRLGAKQTVAFLSRAVTPTPPSETHARADVPMDLIADKLYPGKVAEQTTGAPSDVTGEWWGAVVMRQ